MSARLVVLQPLPPAKPKFGSPCNRCGECCRRIPCALANDLLRQYIGACKALREHEDGTTSCGIVIEPLAYMPKSMLRAQVNYLKRGWPKEIPADATDEQVLRVGLGTGSCDMVERSAGGIDSDIPYGADLDAIKAERAKRWETL